MSLEDAFKNIDSEGTFGCWTFSRFVVGRLIGSSFQTISSDLRKKWEGIFEDPISDNRPPLGMAQFLVMRAYTEVVQPRPPGNIHAGQRMEIYSTPALGQCMLAEIRCADKYVKRDRKLVIFEVTLSDQESCILLFKSKVTVFWAQ